MDSSIEESRFSHKIARLQGHKILRAYGEIDAYTATQFKYALTSFLDGSEKHLVIDMCNVKYMDSSGFGVLVYALNCLVPDGGTVNLVGCTPTLDQVLHITKLHRIILLHQNMDDALKTIYTPTTTLL